MDMEFNNLRRNILARLGKKSRKSNPKKFFDLDSIHSDYSDIPEKDVAEAVRSLNDKGFILFSKDGQSIQLTQKGLNRLHIIKDRENNDEVVLAKKIGSRKQHQECFEGR